MAFQSAQHRPAWDTAEKRAARRAEERWRYDQRRRDDPIRRFYLTPEWKRIRDSRLILKPVCPCGAPATQVDHILSVREHWALRFEPSNLRDLCQSCHSRKTAATSIAGHNRHG